jgi:ATP-dependent protease Clp ATPase subunit
MIKEQEEFIKELTKLVSIFEASEAEIRPHFMLTGPSGSGKSFNIAAIADKFDLGFLEINAAQLTKEGTSGNSLSKALSPLSNMQGQLTICFVDEFDKLFISGNSNSDLAHESTNGVQNEFLKVLESDTASVFGDYGKYVNINVKNVLFVFAGAFNGEEDLDIDRLREIGIKTEFLGRVGLIFNTAKVSLKSLVATMKNCRQMEMYLQLFPKVKRKQVEETLENQLTEAYEKNTLGFRLITTLINQYFIKGGEKAKKENKKISFQKTLSL